MRSSVAVFNSNRVNRNGVVFPTPALESCLDQAWRIGLPMFISHDMHRPIGWSAAFGLHLTPELVTLVGTVNLAESTDDSDELEPRVRAHLAGKYADVSEEERSRLLSAMGIDLPEGAVVVRREAVCAIGDGLARRLFPHLFPEDDKHRLTDLKKLRGIGPGVYEKNGVLLFAHRFFRRSQSWLNSTNSPFLEALAQTADEANLQVSIALDPDTVGLPGTFKECVELEYWWGPKFTNVLPAISAGVAHHEADERQKFYHGITRTEFWWHKQAGIQTLEMEEVRDLPSLGLSHEEYACRYVHSMVDSVSAKPNHLDGAVRIYDEGQLVDRAARKISEAGRHSRYVKLWRIDGQLDIARWKELICHFYRDNRLPGEYLGGDNQEDVQDTSAKGAIEGAQPAGDCLDEHEGVHVLVSYHPPVGSTSRPSVEMVPSDVCEADGQQTPFVEFSALDLVKLLQSRGCAAHLSANTALFAFEDLDINLPLVLHTGARAVADGNATLAGIRDLVCRLASTSQSRFLTAELGVSYPDRLVKFAFAGRARPLAKYAEKLAGLPERLDQIATWCESEHARLKELFPGAVYRASHLDLIRPSGEIRATRRMAQPQEIRRDGDQITHLIIKRPLDETQDVPAGLTAVQFGEVKLAMCSRCNSDYRSCPCAALVEPEVTVVIQDYVFHGFVLTRRPAAPPNS